MASSIQCRSPNKIRELYAILTSSCSLSNPQTLEISKKSIWRNVLGDNCSKYMHTDMPFNKQIYNETLIIIEIKVFIMVGKKLYDFVMISPRQVDGNDFDNEIARELGDDFIALQHQVTELTPQLTPEQSHVGHQVLRKIESSCVALFFSPRPWRNRKNDFAKPIINVSQRKRTEDRTLQRLLLV
ncbi:uncharacterized protein TNIN_199801 [Trichonephila inaurata madagascariensis]|uniref:Uncharacterized protein n=1 Tax=Trichonephila inaurata madagascariensis TaxID=2747483 RepID=A0A8X7CLC8_9ARAC|nr:uncharacterized protein TNIN_199801 [Trichonephila inaurata madagascariensis]